MLWVFEQFSVKIEAICRRLYKAVLLPNNPDRGGNS